MKINYHVFTHNTDEFTTDIEEAYCLYNSFVHDFDCARLYEEKRTGDGELLDENCIESHGDFPA